MNEQNITIESDDQELIVANKRVTLALTIICTIITLAYVLEVVKGTRTIGYVLIVAALAYIPVIACQIFIRRDPTTRLIKQITGVGYAIMYAFVLLTSDNPLVFTYVIPMLIIITLYDDVKYIMRIGIGVIIVNIASVINQFLQGQVTDTAVVEIQALLTIMIIIYLIWVSRTNHLFQLIRTERMAKEHAKTEKLLEDVLMISGRVTETSGSLSDEMTVLKESIDQTLDSMEQVTQGTNESANAAQDQLAQTNEISNHINDVETSAKTITDNVGVTAEAVATGQENIKRMNKLTETVDTAGKDVANALDSFRQTAAEMNSITDIITSVASQTSLLALNASIEAARAGDAGRGFAVVATEISNLAGQTTSATENITGLINQVTSQVGAMVETIENLLRAGEEESKCATETAESFDKISSSVEAIEKHSKELDDIVDRLSKANEEIVNSISTASAVTEEVTAHATETLDTSKKNQQIVTHINSLVENLSEDAEKLKANL